LSTNCHLKTIGLKLYMTIMDNNDVFESF
jgi:hypothetical protein